MSEFVPSVTITLAEYQQLLKCKEDLAHYRLPPAPAPAPAAPAAPAPPEIDLEDLPPVVEEKLLRGMTAQAENLNTEEFETLSAWLLKLARQAFPKAFTVEQLIKAAAARHVALRPGVVLTVLQISHREGQLDYTLDKTPGAPIYFTFRKL